MAATTETTVQFVFERLFGDEWVRSAIPASSEAEMRDAKADYEKFGRKVRIFKVTTTRTEELMPG